VSKPARALAFLAALLAGAASAPTVPAGARSPIGQPGRQPGAIRGRVEFRRVRSAGERRPAVADLGASTPARPDERTRAVVYLETAPGGAFEERDNARVRMDQRNEAFVPHLLAITAGTTVDFPNNDRTYHNVFSLSKTKRFDLGRYAAGHSKAVLFDQPGIVRVFCDIHSHMNAYILVFGHRFYSVTDAEGRYRIDRVPPGTYTIIAWNEGEARETRQVVVPEGATIETDLMVK
jgi:plastocyanin